MLVCQSCWEVYRYIVSEGSILSHCPNAKCFGNELDDMDEAIIPTIKLLHEKGYYTENRSLCNFFSHGTALTPTCFIVFRERYDVGDLPVLPAGFSLEEHAEWIGLRKQYNASDQIELHDQILKTALDLLHWAKGLDPIK